MQTINLKQYYPFCTEDTFVEVSDEIIEAFLLDKRAEAARERKMYRYKAFYSLDCDDGIENADLLRKEHAERHANRNDDLHVPREKLAQSNPLLHMLL